VLNDALELAQEAMEKAFDRLQKDLARIRTGRANPTMLEEVRVDSYGTMMPIQQMATISVSDARMLVIKPWDRNNVAAIERSIINSSLGLNPSSDGVVVRVPIPPLTEERRLQLVKSVKEVGENAKIGVRHGRRDANELLKQAQKEKEISEDDMKRGLEKIQTLTDEFIKKVDDVLELKEAAVME